MVCLLAVEIGCPLSWQKSGHLTDKVAAISLIGTTMKNIFNKIKRRTGTVLFAVIGLFIILNPATFITLGGDVGYRIFTAIWALIVGHLAISQMDRHWSYPDDKKKVSLSNFMSNEATPDHKMVIYAALFIAVAIVLAAVVSG